MSGLITRNFNSHKQNWRMQNWRIQNWRIDDDGFLKVTAHILKEGVYPYSAGESGVEDELPGVDPVMQYIPSAEFTQEALDSLEGKPVTVPLIKENEDWHQWRNPENALKDFLTVGTIAGRPTVTNDGCIECDMLIMDANAIAAIAGSNENSPQKNRLVEVSAGYDGTLLLGEGRYLGEPYHATQTNLRFNHVLLLPEGMGRCGYDVRIINKVGHKPHKKALMSKVLAAGIKPKPQEGAYMPNPKTIKLKIGNMARTFRFTNEEDAKTAEAMLKEEEAFNNEALQAALAGKKSLEEEIFELQNQLEQRDQELVEAEAQIEKLLSPEVQDSLAQEVMEQKNAEEAIIEAETDFVDCSEFAEFDEFSGQLASSAGENLAEVAEKEKDAFSNALSRCRNLAERRAVIVTRVMNMRGVKVRGWKQAAFDGAFELLAANAKIKAKNWANAKNKRVLNGFRSRFGKHSGNHSGNNFGNQGRHFGAYGNSFASPFASPFERMLRPMQARNAKPAANAFK